MLESPAEGPHTRPTTQLALRAHRKRRREAWKLPRTTAKTAPRDPLDWNRFRDLYYPDSRRHNFEAIIAYGACKRSLHAGSPATETSYPNGNTISTDVRSLDDWEAEGGAPPPEPTQHTQKKLEIPIPKQKAVLNVFEKAAKAVPGRGTDSPTSEK